MQQAPQQFDIGGAGVGTQDQNFTHLSLGVDQTIYDFGRAAGRLASTSALTRSAALSYAAVEQDLLLQTISAYFRVLSAAALITAAEDEINQTKAHLRTAEALYEQGVVTRNDLLQAEIRLAASQQQMLARTGAKENAWLELNYLISRSPEARDDLVAEPVAPLEPESEQVDQRPDLLSQSERIQSAQAAIQEAKGEFRPEFFGHLGADYVENSRVKEQTIYAATLGLRFTLYDGGAHSSRLSQAQENLRHERQRLENLTKRARRDQQTARNDALVASQQIGVAQATIQQAQENLRINQERYLEQVGTATEVLDAETLLTQARTSLIQSQFEYQVAVARVRHAAGRL